MNEKAMASGLEFSLDLPIRMHDAGLFVSRGKGTHPTRSIDSHEIIFIRTGTLELFEEQQQFTVRPGEFLHLLPGRKHGGTAPYTSELSFYWIHFKFVPPQQASKPVRFRISLPKHGAVSRPDRVVELLRRYLHDRESEALTPCSGALAVTQILEEMVRPAASRTPPTDSQAQSLAIRADEFIVTHFHEPISASDVAKHLTCNPDYLGRVYRSARQLTLTDAINKARLQFARKLLLDSVMNIDQIAAASGFQDAGYFRRIFRRTEGVAPLRFRRSFARMHINTE